MTEQGFAWTGHDWSAQWGERTRTSSINTSVLSCATETSLTNLEFTDEKLPERFLISSFSRSSPQQSPAPTPRVSRFSRRGSTRSKPRLPTAQLTRLSEIFPCKTTKKYLYSSLIDSISSPAMNVLTLQLAASWWISRSVRLESDPTLLSAARLSDSDIAEWSVESEQPMEAQANLPRLEGSVMS